MMSKFEMALLTVTVVGTLVAWPALQQDSFVRPTDGATGMATLRWFTASTTSGKRSDQSLPRRVMSRMPTESLRAIRR